MVCALTTCIDPALTNLRFRVHVGVVPKFEEGDLPTIRNGHQGDAQLLGSTGQARTGLLRGLGAVCTAVCMVPMLAALTAPMLTAALLGGVGARLRGVPQTGLAGV